MTFNFSYNTAVFMAAFFLLVPLTLVMLCRRVSGWRKALWMILAVAFSWWALVALLVLVPRDASVAEERTKWQQRTWVVATLMLITLISPAFGLWSKHSLNLPAQDFAGKAVKSAYDVIENNNFAKNLLGEMKAIHGWRLDWHVVFTNVVLLQKDTVGLSPIVRVRFADGSTVKYTISRISWNSLLLEADEGQDADGNLIYTGANAKQYRGDQGTLNGLDNIAGFVDHLEAIGFTVINESAESSAVQWRCPGPDLQCIITSGQ